MTRLRNEARSPIGTYAPAALAASLLLALAAGLPIPLDAAEAELPAAEEILDAYVDATGGLANREKLTNRVTVSSLELPGQGVKLHLTIHSARPNKNYTVIESDVTGRIEKGTDGVVVWENSATMGPQIKEGQEKTDFLREVNFDRFEVWRDLYGDVECIGTDTIDDRPVYEVVLTPPEGKPHTMYFDTETRLLVKHEFVLENPMGSIPMTSYIGDYRPVDGVLYAHNVRAVVMGQERVLTTESIRHNVDLPADRFELPAEISALLEK